MLNPTLTLPLKMGGNLLKSSIIKKSSPDKGKIFHPRRIRLGRKVGLRGFLFFHCV